MRQNATSVAAMATIMSKMSTKAQPIACIPKKMGLHSALSAS